MAQLLGIRVPADNLRGPLYMEQVLDALHTRNPLCRRVQLEIGRHGEEVMLYCRLPTSLVQTFLHRIPTRGSSVCRGTLSGSAIGGRTADG